MTRTPPHDVEAEKSLLGGILIATETTSEVAEVLAMLVPESFYVPAHQPIFAAMQALHAAQQPIDVVTVVAQLRDLGALKDVGGGSSVTGLSDCAVTAANVGHYAKIVHEHRLGRRVIEAAQDAANAAYGGGQPMIDVVDQSARIFSEIAISKESRDAVVASVLVKDEMAAMEKRYEHDGTVLGLRTGFDALDEATCGLERQEVYVIAARPGIGKTALALNIADSVAVTQEVPTLVFALEMNRQQCIQRMMCARGGVDTQRMRTGKFKQTEWPRLAKAGGELSRAKLFVDDSSDLTILDLRAKARRHKLRDNIGLIVVDYLQLMAGSGGAQNREREISDISRGLKNAAKELDIPIIALSQLNRGVEQRQDKRPMLSDLRESGSIEQDASTVMFLYRDDYYDKNSADAGIAELGIAKNRNGPTPVIELRWQPNYARFMGLPMGKARRGQ